MKSYRVRGTNARIVPIGHAQVLVSYETPVAAKIDGRYFSTTEYYSRTTNAHVKEFLAGNQATPYDQAFFDRLLKGA
jgi:hypothetical protein